MATVGEADERDDAGQQEDTKLHEGALEESKQLEGALDIQGATVHELFSNKG